MSLQFANEIDLALNVRHDSYHADEPAVLVRLQEEHWKPILDWAREAFGVEIKVSDSIFVPSQPQETMKKFEEILSNFSSWEMAGTQVFVCQ